MQVAVFSAPPYDVASLTIANVTAFERGGRPLHPMAAR